MQKVMITSIVYIGMQKTTIEHVASKVQIQAKVTPGDYLSLAAGTSASSPSISSSSSLSSMAASSSC